MSTKKFLQLLVLISLLAASFATTTGASAAYYCGTSVTVVKGDTLRKIAERCGTTVYALRRDSAEGADHVLVLANTDAEKAQTVALKSADLRAPAAPASGPARKRKGEPQTAKAQADVAWHELLGQSV
ncbi:LysM domain-containing protein, partial [Candidatus Microgenomates bacterium]